MKAKEEISAKKILVVARWPLGGIRTYMRYIFSHFPSKYKLTLLVASTHEDSAIKKDATFYNADLKLVKATGTCTFMLESFRELRKNRYDMVLSQGFISAVVVFMANLIFRVPHILTIHGIVEPKYFIGRFLALKRLILGSILSSITALYAVSNDILEHLYEQFPQLRHDGPKSIVIHNGIEPSDFEQFPAMSINLRKELGIDNSAIVFGFFGRFMPQKGFDLLIDAADRIRTCLRVRPFAILAVGSGDYLREYQSQISKLGLEQFFYFLPFQQQVHHLYPHVDAIVMPSRWEACPLLPMEALCMGTPLIASNCIGLREAVIDTPTMVFSSENVSELVELMLCCMQNNDKKVFQKFSYKARERYNVANSAKELVRFIENLLERK